MASLITQLPALREKQAAAAALDNEKVQPYVHYSEGEDVPYVFDPSLPTEAKAATP